MANYQDPRRPSDPNRAGRNEAPLAYGYQSPGYANAPNPLEPYSLAGASSRAALGEYAGYDSGPSMTARLPNGAPRSPFYTPPDAAPSDPAYPDPFSRVTSFEPPSTVAPDLTGGDPAPPSSGWPTGYNRAGLDYSGRTYGGQPLPNASTYGPSDLAIGRGTTPPVDQTARSLATSGPAYRNSPEVEAAMAKRNEEENRQYREMNAAPQSPQIATTSYAPGLFDRVPTALPQPESVDQATRDYRAQRDARQPSVAGNVSALYQSPVRPPSEGSGNLQFGGATTNPRQPSPSRPAQPFGAAPQGNGFGQPRRPQRQLGSQPSRRQDGFGTPGAPASGTQGFQGTTPTRATGLPGGGGWR